MKTNRWHYFEKEWNKRGRPELEWSIAGINNFTPLKEYVISDLDGNNVLFNNGCDYRFRGDDKWATTLHEINNKWEALEKNNMKEDKNLKTNRWYYFEKEWLKRGKPKIEWANPGTDLFDRTNLNELSDYFAFNNAFDYRFEGDNNWRKTLSEINNKWISLMENNTEQVGKKLDDDKLLAGLVLGDFANALEEVVKAGTFGAKKYGPSNWLKVKDAYIRYNNAKVRHMLERDKGNLNDEESKISHLAHEAWNALAMLEIKLRGL